MSPKGLAVMAHSDGGWLLLLFVDVLLSFTDAGPGMGIDHISLWSTNQRCSTFYRDTDTKLRI